MPKLFLSHPLTHQGQQCGQQATRNRPGDWDPGIRPIRVAFAANRKHRMRQSGSQILAPD